MPLSAGALMRRRRLWIAAVLVWCLAFAQAATAAHACVMLGSTWSAQAAQVSAQPMPPGCAEMAKRSGSTTNVCQSHCLAGQHAYGQMDVPTAAIAPQASLIARGAVTPVPAYFTPSLFAPLAAALPSR